jgi:hypothetical protein
LPYKKGNIAVRLGNSIDIEGVLHEVIGIDVDDYGMYLRSIKQRYDGNLQKATLLAKVLSSLGGMTAQSQQAAASGDTSALAAQLLKMGLTSSDIDRIISDAYSGSSAATTFLEENGGPSIWGPL